MNSSVVFVDGGSKYICNLCSFKNAVPPEYFCNLDINGNRVDMRNRPELCHGTVDYVATEPYILRPLVKPCIVFAIDSSTASIRSGAFLASIQAVHDCLTNENFFKIYSKIGIITFDKFINFYDLRTALSSPQAITVTDVDDPFCPLGSGFLTNVTESTYFILI